MTTRRSNRGVPIDFDAIMASAKSVPAVGNMRVNAAGDIIGSGGAIVKKNEDRVREYYKHNPKSSTAQASLKGEANKLTPDAEPVDVPKTAATAKENVRTAKKAVPEVKDLDEFDAPLEPVGYEEITLPNGDIEMVPVYKNDKK
jgi:hypothetical protein